MNVRVAYTWLLVARTARILVVAALVTALFALVLGLLFGAWSHGSNLIVRLHLFIFFKVLLWWSVPAFVFATTVEAWRDFRGGPLRRIDWQRFADSVRDLTVRDWLRPSVMLPTMRKVRSPK